MIKWSRLNRIKSLSGFLGTIEDSLRDMNQFQVY